MLANSCLAVIAKYRDLQAAGAGVSTSNLMMPN
jgi:hypothetical protein